MKLLGVKWILFELTLMFFCSGCFLGGTYFSVNPSENEKPFADEKQSLVKSRYAYLEREEEIVKQ